jgi:hypothetical protein
VDCTVKLLKVREVEREVAHLPAASIFVVCLIANDIYSLKLAVESEFVAWSRGR